MPTLVTDIRQLRKRGQKLATDEPIAPKQIPIEFERAERLSPLDVILGKLERTNPVLRELINTLDLEPISTNLAPGAARLWDLAGQSLEGNRTYTRVEATECIKIRTSVTLERAERGFALMLESGAIEKTHGNKYDTDSYYLAGSTPY